MKELFELNDWKLEDEKLELIPLNHDHIPELVELAMEPRIWQFYAYDMSNREKLNVVFNEAVNEYQAERQLPFVVYHKKQRKLIGSTRFLAIDQTHQKLEIGWTWYHPDYWGTFVNPRCKLLLLTSCFERFNLKRVQFKTDENNQRSRKAILKTGAQFEGILRNDMIRHDGTHRHSAYFSILPNEWDSCKATLLKSIQEKEQK